MSNNPKGRILGINAVAVVVGIVAGVTSRWWLDGFFPGTNPSNLQPSEIIVSSPKAITNPLKIGNYESYSYYLDVFQKGERLCIRASSSNGSTIASVYVSSDDPNAYKAVNYSDSMLLKQIDSTTISFGGRDYTNQRGGGFPQTIPDDVQKCLDSTNPFFDHTPSRGGRSEVQPEDVTTNTTTSSSRALKVQNLANGDYYFTSGKAPRYSGEFFVFRKQDNTIIGWGGIHGSDGSCLRKVILSDSKVETTTVTVDPSAGNGREVQVYRNIAIDDGSLGSSEFSQVDANQYPNFAGTIQTCTEALSN